MNNRQSLAEDIGAFANTVGGNLGISLEAADKREGDSAVAKAFDPVHALDLDAMLPELESGLRDSLEPQLAILQVHPVPLAASGHVIVLRVGRSPRAPHRVVCEGGGHFFLLNSTHRQGTYGPPCHSHRLCLRPRAR